MTRRTGRDRRFDDRHGPRSKNEARTNNPKPNLRERACELGIYALRRQLIEPLDLMVEQQEQLGKFIVNKSGKAYAAGSLAMSIVGLNDYPDLLFKQTGYRAMSTRHILEVLSEEYGLGSSPVEAVPTGDIKLFSKNPRASRQKVVMEVKCPSNNAERLAVETVLREANLGDRLKNHGIKHPIEHVSIGHIDVRQISDQEFERPEKLLPESYSLPDKLIFAPLTRQI